MIRERRPADLPRLAEVLGRQQPVSEYPLEWPLPTPVEEFLVRDGELGAWVAEVDGQVVGHVSLIEVGTGPEVDGWELGTGRSADELAAVSVLFVDPEVGGRGIGSALLAHGAAQARSLGRHPVLDVVSEHVDVIGLYLARGWQVVGEARPVWLPADRAPVLLLHLPQE